MELNKYIDHTLLKPEAVEADIIKLCQEALEYNFMSVCVNPTWVSLASELLDDSDVKVCTVIGFPLGATTSRVKALEAQEAVKSGASEVDMVINIGWVKSGDFDKVKEDIESVVEAVSQKAHVKVIIETCLLNSEEIAQVSRLVEEAGADFVKTSTGFSIGGAKIEDVTLIRSSISPSMGLKASGGISNRQEALAMIKAGATRLGASKGIEIVSQED